MLNLKSSIPLLFNIKGNDGDSYCFFVFGISQALSTNLNSVFVLLSLSCAWHSDRALEEKTTTFCVEFLL